MAMAILNKRERREIFDLINPGCFFGETGAAYCAKIEWGQKFSAKTFSKGRTPLTNGDLDPIRPKIRKAFAGNDLQIHPGVNLCKVAQPRNQPFRSERRGHAKGDTCGFRPQFPCCLVNDSKRAAHWAVIVPPGLCQFKATHLSVKQFEPEIGFKPAHLLRDCPLGEVQLLSRACEVQVPGGGVKHAERVQVWSSQGVTFCNAVVFLQPCAMRHDWSRAQILSMVPADTSKGETDMASRKVALITAGGSGMGADAARRLASEGYEIGILSSSGKGEALAAELGGVGVTGSNRSVEDLQKLVDLVTRRWGRIDALVNSAGHGPKGPVMEISDQEWHDGMETYLLNVVRPARIVAPIMAANGGGAIVNISTFAAFEPDPLFPTSGVFRAALASFSKLFADKFAPENVRMNNILPGFIDSLPETEDRRARIPMGRYGKAGEVSALIAYLASEDAAYVTGQNIRIDGGLTHAV